MDAHSNYYMFKQNGKHLEYSNLKDFTLAPVEVRRLCANMETFYTEKIYELLEGTTRFDHREQNKTYVPQYYPENRDKLSGHKRKFREIE